MAKWKHVLNTDQKIEFWSFEVAAQAAVDVGYPAFTWKGWVYASEYATGPDDEKFKLCKVSEVE